MVDYKLRLGDGTTFSVDEKGLTTWLQGGLVDDKARVQPAGSKKWFSIKQVLAAQGTQRGHAIRQTEEGRADVDRQAAEETAEIERKVAGQRAAEERKAAEDLAAAERKAAEDRNAAERKLIEDREATARYVAEEAAAAEARAAAERAEAEEREAARVADAEQRVAAERAERAELKRQAEEARQGADQRAADEARLEAERAAAEQRAAAERRAAEQQAAEQDAAEKQAAAILVAEKKAAEKQAAARKAAEDREAAARREAEAREAAAREAAREADRVAEAERLVAAERAERAERKRAEAERLAEQQARLAAQHAEERAASAFATPDPPATEIAIEPAATMVKVEEFERELGLVPVPFNDDVASSGAAGVPSVETPKAVVHFLVRLSQMLEGVVTRVVRVFARRAAPAAPAPLVEERAAPAPQAPRPAPPPVPPLWAAPAPTPPPKPIATPAGAIREPAGVQRPPAVPPPSFQKLEVIPFAAAAVESKAVEDMWGGDDPLQEPSAIASTVAGVWRWVKRVTITTAVIVGIALLVLNRERWLPQAKDASTYLGQGVDKLQERATTRTVPPAAIETARAQIPYLRPQTIEMIMARSTGVLEPAEVFRRAHQAAERARPSLPENVVAEIDNLTGAVAAQLDPAEDERLRAYFAAIRAGTPTAAYQDKEAVWLTSRGARRLPAEKLARMEELFAQAVAAALQPPKS